MRGRHLGAQRSTRDNLGMMKSKLTIGLQLCCLLSCLLLALSACGNKGPLVQAEDEEQQKTETGTE